MPVNEFTPAAQAALNKALSGAASNHHRLQSWVAANMPDVGAGLVAGSIIWNKALGRPSTQNLCDGFSIMLIARSQQNVGTPGDGGGVEKWIDATFAVDNKWDDNDGESYLVHFLHVMTHGDRLRVIVSFADGVGWQDASGGRSSEHLIVSPSEYQYGLKLQHTKIPNWIESFRVMRALDSASVYKLP